MFFLNKYQGHNFYHQYMHLCDTFHHLNCKHIHMRLHHNQDAPLVQRNLKFLLSHQHIRFLDKLDTVRMSFPICDPNRHNTLDIQEHLYIHHSHNSPRHILCLLHMVHQEQVVVVEYSFQPHQNKKPLLLSPLHNHFQSHTRYFHQDDLFQNNQHHL